jgi:uncharacterized protein (UPF0335 family)
MPEEWNSLVEYFSRITDTRGKPIDPEIFETVVVLNALGIPTIMSCGGHIDDGRDLLLPWIDIASSAPYFNDLQHREARLVQESERAHQEIMRLRIEQAEQERLKTAQQQARTIYTELHAVQWDMRVAQVEVRTKLAAYLARFYEDRVVPFDRRLILEGRTKTRLHNQGALDFYLTSPEEIQRARLQEYREEIAAFTSFLKQVYHAL